MRLPSSQRERWRSAYSFSRSECLAPASISPHRTPRKRGYSSFSRAPSHPPSDSTKRTPLPSAAESKPSTSSSKGKATRCWARSGARSWPWTSTLVAVATPLISSRKITALRSPRSPSPSVKRRRQHLQFHPGRGNAGAAGIRVQSRTHRRRQYLSLQSNDISQYAWEISGADNSFAVTQTETLITSQELSWRGDQGTAAFDFTGASEIALATVVDGLRTTLTQRFESADQASVTATLLGNDNTLALSAVNVSVLNYLIAVNGVSNLLSLSAENASNARLDLEVLGNRNTISTLQRDVSDASIQVRLSGSDNQLTIEQSATPGL